MTPTHNTRLPQALCTLFHHLFLVLCLEALGGFPLARRPPACSRLHAALDGRLGFCLRSTGSAESTRGTHDDKQHNNGDSDDGGHGYRGVVCVTMIKACWEIIFV